MTAIEAPLRPDARARPLLICGVLVSPLFFLLVFGQAFTRQGFDIRRAPLSLLSIGDLGWIQIANFIGTGVLALAFAAGLRSLFRGRTGGTWGPLLIGIYGLGLIVAGVFHPDPGYNFPPGVGAPAGMLPTTSGHAALHAAGFLIVVASLIVACFVFARAFRSIGWSRLSLYSAATGVGTPLLLVAGLATNTLPLITAMAVLAFSWVSVIAGALLRLA